MSDEKKVMTADETNNQTRAHIIMVRNFLNLMVIKLLRRGELHDQTKLEQPELDIFTEFTPKLAGSTYGSDEYEGFRAAMKPALDHHYAKNRHHPEHFKDGINDMNLLDLIEMFCDWKAATLRHNDGNIKKSIETNQKRFGMDHQMTQIFLNSIELLEDD